MTHSSASTLPFSSYQKFLIVILALLQFTVILDFIVLSPLGDIIIKSLTITPAKFGVVVSSYAFSAGVASLLAAGFADQFDRKKLLLFFYSGFIIGTLCCGLADSYAMLLAARIITGLFAGVISSILLAIITDEFVVHQRGRVMGFVQMAFAVSQVLGVPISIYLATRWHWHTSFRLIVIVAVLIGLAVLFKMRPVTKHLALQSNANPLAHLWHTIVTKTYWTGFLAIACNTMSGFMLMPFTSTFLINNVHLSQQELPLVYLFTGLSSILIMPLIGRLSDRFSKFKLFAAGSALAIVTVLIYTRIPPIPLWEVILLNVVMTIGIMSRMIPATTLNTSIPAVKDRGAYLSITSSLQQMAGGLASVVAGLIVVQPTKTSPLVYFDVLGYVAAAVILICIVLMYRANELVFPKQLKSDAAPTTVPQSDQTLILTK